MSVTRITTGLIRQLDKLVAVPIIHTQVNR